MNWDLFMYRSSIRETVEPPLHYFTVVETGSVLLVVQREHRKTEGKLKLIIDSRGPGVFVTN